MAGADVAAATDAAGTCVALAGVGVTDMDFFSFTTAAGGVTGAFALTTGFAATLTGDADFTGVLATALASAGLAVLDSGLADFTGTALTGVVTAGLAVALGTTFATGLAADLLAAAGLLGAAFGL